MANHSGKATQSRAFSLLSEEFNFCATTKTWVLHSEIFLTNFVYSLPLVLILLPSSLFKQVLYFSLLFIFSFFFPFSFFIFPFAFSLFLFLSFSFYLFLFFLFLFSSFPLFLFFVSSFSLFLFLFRCFFSKYEVNLSFFKDKSDLIKLVGDCYILYLPNETLLEILSPLLTSTRECLKLASVCLTWRSVQSLLIFIHYFPLIKLYSLFFYSFLIHFFNVYFFYMLFVLYLTLRSLLFFFSFKLLCEGNPSFWKVVALRKWPSVKINSRVIGHSFSLFSLLFSFP